MWPSTADFSRIMRWYEVCRSPWHCGPGAPDEVMHSFKVKKMRAMWGMAQAASGKLLWHWEEIHFSRMRGIKGLSSGDLSSCIRLGPTARVPEPLAWGSRDSQSLNTHLLTICNVLGTVPGFEIEMWAGQTFYFLSVRQHNWQIKEQRKILYNITG